MSLSYQRKHTPNSFPYNCGLLPHTTPLTCSGSQTVRVSVAIYKPCLLEDSLKPQELMLNHFMIYPAGQVITLKSLAPSSFHGFSLCPLGLTGISGDKVEIDPVTNQKASTKFWIKQKPISIDSDLLCACDLAEEKSPSE